MATNYVHVQDHALYITSLVWWGAMKWWDLLIQKIYMAKWHQFRLFLAPHITKCSYINALSYLPVLQWFPAAVWAIWSHLQTTRASVDARQAHEWSLSKSRPLNLWQWYKHELLVYCICQMSETWNCVRIGSVLANLVTFIVLKSFHTFNFMGWG